MPGCFIRPTLATMIALQTRPDLNLAIVHTNNRFRLKCKGDQYDFKFKLCIADRVVQESLVNN
jgi:hypothetical protein